MRGRTELCDVRLRLHHAWLVVWCLSLLGCGNAKDAGEAASAEVDSHRAVVVDVKPVERRDIGRSITAIGRCEALPENQALITPVIEGRVSELLAKRGDEVKPGQPIVQLDTTLARADLTEKIAARDSLIASLKVLQSTPRTEEQRASKLAIDQAVLAVERAQAQLDRLKPLRERNEVPEAQIVDAKSALKQAAVQQQTARAQFEQLMIAPRKEVVAEAQSKVTMAEDAIKTAQARLDLHTIRAPIAGTLDNLSCRPGQSIAVGAAVGEVINSRQILAVAWLPASSHQTVQPGQAASIRVQSIEATTKAEQRLQSIEGRVVYVGRSTDPQTGNVSVHVLAENGSGQLVIGQTLEVEIQIQKPTKHLCVPLAAIRDEDGGPAVTVVRDGKAVVVHPHVGVKDADWIEVTSDELKDDDLVAVAGAYNLPDGTSVETNVIREAPAAQHEAVGARKKAE